VSVRCARLLALALALFASALAPPAAADSPRRVCSVSLAGDELLALLVPAERVVCVTRFADDEATSNVAGHYPADVLRVSARLEPVVGRAPDLVLAAPWNTRAFLDRLEALGIPHHVLGEMSSFDQIAAEVVELGRRLGVQERANQVVAKMRADLRRLERRVASVESRPRVMSFSHLVVAGSGTSVDAVIRAAGGVNAAAEAGVEGHTKLPMENVLDLDPDVLLLGFDPGDARTDDGVEAVVEAYPHLAHTRAVESGRVVMLAPRHLTTVTPFLVEGARRLAEALHPGLPAEGGGETTPP
jgi:iron complex transport system substrate-binding protein